MSTNEEVINLAKKLISIPSISPQDLGCQQIITNILQPLGFKIEDLTFNQTKNSWITYGTEKPCFCFAGHIDVVPPGKIEDWKLDPFSGEIIDNVLYGRGAADMKGSVAAFTIACKNFVTKHPNFKGKLALLITSDEEADFIDGTTKVVDTLKSRNELIDYCIVGEPSSAEKLGDTIRIGRRGSITANIFFKGIQGHVANPQKALNPIHKSLKVLDKLVQYEWDKGNDFFPATSMQIPNIKAGTGANNVIPGELFVQINWRFCTETSVEKIKDITNSILKETNLDFQINWSFSGDPFLSKIGELVNATQEIIQNKFGYSPELSTGGGTSDGRFIAKITPQIIELGPINSTIHKVNECVAVQDLIDLAEIYEKILEKILL